MGSHKMETTAKSSRKRRARKKKKGSKVSELNSLQQNSKSLTRNLSVNKLDMKKNNCKKVKKVAQHYLNSIIEGFCEQQIAFAQSQKKDCEDCGQLKCDLFEKTVDLCNDSFVNDSNSSLVILPSFEAESKSEVVIDLCNDLTEQNEIVDLTQPHSKPESDCNELEPTVIDISEDEAMEKSNLKPENDEILVIGTFSNSSKLNEKCKIPSLINFSSRCNNFNNIINCSDKLKTKYLKKRSVLDKIDNKNAVQYKRKSELPGKSSCSSKVARIGENIYVNSPVVLPTCGLRPIVIDGSNVAYVHSNSNFSCKRLEICINYFKEKGHKVTAFVPQYRLSSHRSDDPQLLRKLERQGDVILTPSKKIDGRNIVPYDDRFIVQTAVLKGGIIVTRDNYNDLLKENPSWAETIKYRTLAFTWVDDVLMFPKDPLGEHGPSLEEFLRFQ